MSARKMLIDGAHAEETRVVIASGNRLEDFDIEVKSRRQIKGNIYLAKVIRVEPSLQAAFVDFGGNRHGFLAFNEIHPDYYQIPVADRAALIEEQHVAEDEDDDASEDGGDENAPVETIGGDEVDDEAEARRAKPPSRRHYKIQEVIKRRQILLVQVTKEERGNKGAALTTYISLPGRYCVLMPNTARGGGVSRKIANGTDRRKLKAYMNDLEIPPGMAVIVRTAGAKRTRAEIKRDYEYLLRLWTQIRDTTLESTAPCQIYEEGNLIKRAIRDLYSKDIEEIIIEGNEAYRMAKDFMKLLIPSHAKRVQPYKEDDIPLFHRYHVENQLDAMHDNIVPLRSGGYLVLNQTEALVAVDVNSGKATRERNIEETALNTNLEAAEEVARQIRLRDLAGLVVIDFIDMDVNRNNAKVERQLKEAMKSDRARIQIGRISPFGLLELSRQRLRPSLMETSSEVCTACGGNGHRRSVDSAALSVVRAIEEEAFRRRSRAIAVHVASDIALYILNHKRRLLTELEGKYAISVSLEADDSLVPPDHRMERIGIDGDTTEEAHNAASRSKAHAKSPATRNDGDESMRKRRRRRVRRHNQDGSDGDHETLPLGADDAEDAAPHGREAVTDDEAVDATSREKSKRRRGRRGGRRRSRKHEANEAVTDAPVDREVSDDGPDDDDITEADALKEVGVEESRESPTDTAEDSAGDTRTPDGNKIAPEITDHTKADPASATVAADAARTTVIVVGEETKPEGARRGWWRR